MLSIQVRLLRGCARGNKMQLPWPVSVCTIQLPVFILLVFGCIGTASPFVMLWPLRPTAVAETHGLFLPSAASLNGSHVTECILSSAGLAASDCQAWVALYDSTKGEQWANCSALRLDPCSCKYGPPNNMYEGVTCDHDRHNIIGIFLATNRLAGSLPRELSQLSKLQFLRVGYNHLTGIVPSLPFHQYTGGCELIDHHAGSTGGNQYACPLPPNAATCKQPKGTFPYALICNGSSLCTGSSAGLAPAECDAWIQLYDSTGGSDWSSCSGHRSDPCSCSQSASYPKGVWCDSDK